MGLVIFKSPLKKEELLKLKNNIRNNPHIYSKTKELYEKQCFIDGFQEIAIEKYSRKIINHIKNCQRNNENF